MGLFGLMTRKEAQEAINNALKQAARYAPWLLSEAQSARWNPPDLSKFENQAELMMKLSWVYAAVDMTAQAAALTPFSVARPVAGKEPKDLPNHAFEELLNNPNPLDSRFEFLYATFAYWKLNGNCYWWLNRTSENDIPEELWIIPPYMIEPVPDGKMYLKGYVYHAGNGQDIPLETHEIVHFKTMNPKSRFYGRSAIESLAVVTAGHLGMQDWNTRLFKENNARLASVLAFKDYPANDVWEDIKKEARDAAKKRDILMLRGVGEGLQWLQNTLTQKEMEFLGGLDHNQKEIWAVLAPGLMSMMSENATEANSRTGRATFLELTVYPLHVMASEKISGDILPAYPGRPLIGHFDDIRMSDRSLELEEQKQFAMSHTVDEIREEYYGDESIGDERGDLIPVQLNAQSGGIQEPPKQPNPFQPQGQQPQGQAQPGAVPANPQEQNPANADASTKAALDALMTWERAARKSKNRAVDFRDGTIPPHIAGFIRERLPICKSNTGIKALFDKAAEMLAPQPHSEILQLAAAINRLADAK